MLQVYPDYYKDFRCIAGECHHNCCIGWEIDIDPDSAAYYESLAGEFGKRLRENISHDGDVHFVLGDNERCPFLNQDNLCDIILMLGEEKICNICTEHPRFYNELPGRVETGIGLCCEEAARLILQQSEPTKLIFCGEDTEWDEVLSIRDEVIAVLQNRGHDIESRICRMLIICGIDSFEVDFAEWICAFMGLERLDEAWTDALALLRDNWEDADLQGFDQHMAERQTEYEQLLVYFVYRYLANATDEIDLSVRAAFAALSYKMIRMIGAVIWKKSGEFAFADHVEVVRLFSSEIEYSNENLDMIFEKLSCMFGLAPVE